MPRRGRPDIPSPPPTYTQLVQDSFQRCRTTIDPNTHILTGNMEEKAKQLLSNVSFVLLYNFGMREFRNIDSDHPRSIGLDQMHYIKMDRGAETLVVPLDTCFLNYSIDFESPPEPTIIHNENKTKLGCCFKTVYGTFYFVFVSICMPNPSATEPSQIRLRLDSKYRNAAEQNPFPALIATLDSPREGEFIAMARIEPYVCKVCGVYRDHMKKCSGCWKFLGVSIRYCSTRCRDLDYHDNGHRRVCGGFGRSRVALQAITKRKNAIQTLDLSDELIERGTGHLGFKRPE